MNKVEHFSNYKYIHNCFARSDTLDGIDFLYKWDDNYCFAKIVCCKSWFVSRKVSIYTQVVICYTFYISIIIWEYYTNSKYLFKSVGWQIIVLLVMIHFWELSFDIHEVRSILYKYFILSRHSFLKWILVCMKPSSIKTQISEWRK